MIDVNAIPLQNAKIECNAIYLMTFEASLHVEGFLQMNDDIQQANGKSLYCIIETSSAFELYFALDILAHEYMQTLGLNASPPRRTFGDASQTPLEPNMRIYPFASGPEGCLQPSSAVGSSSAAPIPFFPDDPWERATVLQAQFEKFNSQLQSFVETAKNSSMNVDERWKRLHGGSYKCPSCGEPIMPEGAFLHCTTCHHKWVIYQW